MLHGAAQLRAPKRASPGVTIRVPFLYTDTVLGIQALALVVALRDVFASLASGTSAWRRFESLCGAAKQALPTPPRHGRTQIKASRSSKWMRTIFCGRWTSRSCSKLPHFFNQLRRLLTPAPGPKHTQADNSNQGPLPCQLR